MYDRQIDDICDTKLDRLCLRKDCSYDSGGASRLQCEYSGNIALTQGLQEHEMALCCIYVSDFSSRP
jgi:hypothetical protein